MAGGSHLYSCGQARLRTVTERRKSYWNNWRIWRRRSPSCGIQALLKPSCRPALCSQCYRADLRASACFTGARNTSSGSATKHSILLRCRVGQQEGTLWTNKQLRRSECFPLGNEWPDPEHWIYKTHADCGIVGHFCGCRECGEGNHKPRKCGQAAEAAEVKGLCPEPLPTS